MTYQTKVTQCHGSRSGTSSMHYFLSECLKNLVGKLISLQLYFRFSSIFHVANACLVTSRALVFPEAAS